MNLLEKFKLHIHYDEGIDETMLSFYLKNAERYVLNATGHVNEYIVLLVAGIMWEYRASEKELEDALNAITPFIVQEVFTIAETDNQ